MLSIDNQTLEQVQRLNRWLALAPRFKINRWTPRLAQALLRVSQLGADRRLTRTGIAVENRVVAMEGLRVPVRILRPAGRVRGVVFDLHGGGWVIGNARMNDKLNAALAAACGVIVVSVDYRLALDTPMQGVMDDCLAAARWLLGGGLAGAEGLPVFAVGESAGGHLAAATLLRLKAWPALLGRMAGAVLYYGVYDLAGTPSVHRAGPDTLLLDGPGMPAEMRMLTPELDDGERRRPPLSPLYGDLTGLPPALMFVGERDPLRDDTLMMAERWGRMATGEAAVEMHLVPEATHGLIHFPTRMADLVTARSHAWIRERLDLLERTPA